MGIAANRHERPDDGGRRVKLGHTVLLYKVPESIRRGMRGDALEDDLGGAVEQGSVGDIGMTSNPTAVGSAPKHITLMVIERIPTDGE